jgi:1,4-dihydroxy-2-naphthoyl-CoA hydrolase
MNAASSPGARTRRFDPMQIQPGPLDKLLGFRPEELSGDRAVVSLTVTPDLHQPMGIVHGGVYSALVETTASYAATAWLDGDGYPVGTGNHTEFLGPASKGELRAEATPLHRGRSTQLWRVEVADESGRLVAHGQVRLMNIRDSNGLG